jgi:hypothetical protein
MSDHSRHGRRIAARVVPITKLEPAPVLPRRTAPASAPTPANPTVRPRAYGAPLVAGSRLPRSMRRSATHVVESDVPGTFGDVLAKSAGRRVGTREPADVEAVAPLVIWEQPPQPRDESGVPAPRSLVDAAAAPTESEYAWLASHVGVMLAGFADFARSPGVVESGNWHARLEMPDTVLPATVLEMEVSASHARLRFETDHQVSRGVLSRYGARLQMQVKAALDDARVVEVVLW